MLCFHSTYDFCFFKGKSILKIWEKKSICFVYSGTIFSIVGLVWYIVFFLADMSERLYYLYSGFSKSNLDHASRFDLWFPYAGIHHCFLSIFAICIRFQVMNVVFLLVKSFSGHHDHSSRYDGPGPASPTRAASACGGIVNPRCWSEYNIPIAQCLAPSSFPVMRHHPTRP